MPELTGSSLVCFSNVEWGSWRQRHHHLMERFARHHQVLFVETPGMRAPNLLSTRDLCRVGRRVGRAVRALSQPRGQAATDNLRIYSPLVLPYHQSGPVRRLNTRLLLRDLRRLLAARDMVNPILWVYLPSDLILQVTRRLPHRLLVYDCADAITEFRDAPADLAASEGRLLDAADLVFASSRPLVQRCSGRRAPVHHVPNAGDVEWFARESRRSAEPAEMASLPRPRVGYVGAMREWFHWELLEAALERFPAASFVLIGDSEVPPRMRSRPNLHVLGPRPYAELPGYLGALDVAMVPFRDTPLVRSTHPVKVYEYLAAGLPVVSTPMEEIRHLAELDMAPAHEPFLQALQFRLSQPRQAAAVERRQRSVAGESWEHRFAFMTSALRHALNASRPALAEIAP